VPIVNIKVAVESEPAPFVVVKMYVPLVVNVVPFYVNELHAVLVVVLVVG
jgi:hypothetical protein